MCYHKMLKIKLYPSNTLVLKNKFSMILKNKKIIKNYIIVIFGNGLSRLTSFIISLILARKLGAEGFGIFSLFYTIMLLIWQLPNVIDTSYVRFVKVDEQNKNKDFLKALLLIKSLICLFLLILAFPLAKILSLYIFNKADSEIPMTLAIVSGAFWSLLGNISAIYQSEEKFDLFSITNGLFYFIILLIFSVFFIININLSPILSISIFTLVAIIIGCSSFIYLFMKIKPIFPLNLSPIFELINFGKWLLVANISYIIFQRLDLVILARYVNYDQIGIYSIGVRLVTIISIFISGVSVVFLPRGVSAFKSEKELNLYLKESLGVSLVLCIIVITFIIVSSTIIKFLFGYEYLSAVILSKILLLGAIFIILYTPFSYLFYAANSSKFIFIFNMFRLITILITSFLLIPTYGSIGAAIASSFSSLCVLIIILIASLKYIKNYKMH